MTLKERIEAFVKQQGNQVGAGAELAAILNDIVDSIPGEYTLPAASTETLGGVKVGSGLAVTEEGVLSASGGGRALIVEGTVEGSDFTPNEGQPSREDAIQAIIIEGRDIVLFVSTDDGPNLYHWVSYDAVDGNMKFGEGITW